jgi:saccharopine dehydrogenase-like NADP-dependent oxidoreductase
MKALDEDAKKAGVLLLNECGVDPGVDHMSAMRIIDQVHSKGGKIKSFTSFTGGLPAPEDNNNPYGYKLSWSPRGVLLAGRNDAHFLRDGKEVLIRGADLFQNYEMMDVPGIGTFEAYPNRDSMSYIEIYNIPETKTMLRGTLRNIGWCETLDKIANLGLLDLEERSLANVTYAAMMRGLTSAGTGNIKTAVARFCGIGKNHPILKRFEWLGLLDEVIIPSGINTRLDALCHLFEQKMQYAPGERDMLVMHHEFIAEYKDKKQKITSTLIDYGIPNGDSSMSRTVALPVAIASKMILEGEINLTGVHRPVVSNLYDPILEELANLRITLQEHVSDL